MQHKAGEGARLGRLGWEVMRGRGLTPRGAIDAPPRSDHVRLVACPGGPGRRLAVPGGAPEDALLARMAFGRAPGVCCVQAGCWRGTRARDAQRA